MFTKQTDQLRELEMRAPEVESFKHMRRLSERLDELAEDLEVVNDNPVPVAISCTDEEFFEGI